MYDPAVVNVTQAQMVDTGRGLLDCGLIDALVALWRALESGDQRRAYRLSLPISSLIAVQQSLDAFSTRSRKGSSLIDAGPSGG